jgi:hypothetical protein
MKKELFKEVLGNVCRSLGLDEDSVIHSNKEECVDARYLLVKALYKLGFTDTEVSELIHHTRQSIGYLRNNYKKSNKWILANNWKNISKWLEDNYLSNK